MELLNGQKLQAAYRQHVQPYSRHIQIAVTLTLRQIAKIRVKRFENYGDEYFEYWHKLDEERVQSTLRYFTAQLTKELFGNQAKHKNKQDWAKPLIIAAVEGKNTNKQIHFHLAIGNIPQEKLGNIEALIKCAWYRCDFANEQVCVKHVSSSFGWLSYLTKEVGYTDNDVLDVCSSTMPKFIQHEICTESRLTFE